MSTNHVLNAHTNKTLPKIYIGNSDPAEMFAEIKTDAAFRKLYVLAELYDETNKTAGIANVLKLASSNQIYTDSYNPSFKNNYILVFTPDQHFERSSNSISLSVSNDRLLLKKGTETRIVKEIEIIADPKYLSSKNTWESKIFTATTSHSSSSTSKKYKVQDQYLTHVKPKSLVFKDIITLQCDILRFILENELSTTLDTGLDLEQLLAYFYETDINTHVTLNKMVGILSRDQLFGTFVSCIDRSRPLILTGAPGTGKTTAARMFSDATAAIHSTQNDHEYVVVSCNKSMDALGIIGQVLPKENNGIYFQPGPLLENLNNVTINIDEFSRAPGSLMDPLLGLLSTPRDDSTLFGLVFQGLTIRIGHATERNLLKYKPEEVDTHKVYLLGSTWNLVFTMNARDNSLMFDLSKALNRRVDILKIDAPYSTTSDCSDIKIKISELITKTMNRYSNSQMDKVELTEKLTRLIQRVNHPQSILGGMGYGLIESLLDNYACSRLKGKKRMLYAYDATLDSFLRDETSYKIEYQTDFDKHNEFIYSCLKDLDIHDC